MNERIKELMDQAGIDVEAVENLGEMPTALKFAELIVRDCIDTMYKRGESYAHPSAGFYQAKTFSEAIMEHFGVEE